MNKTDLTLKYYNENAEKFSAGTIDAGMEQLQTEFLSYIPEGGTILDLGCGSGRDSKAFLDKGYDVIPLDGSEELCKLAESYIGKPVICATFQEYEPDKQLDGVWACSTLLHLEKQNIHDVVKKLTGFLKPGGCFYMSFKYGESSGDRHGRFFTDLTEDTIHELLSDITELQLVREKITSDVRPGRSDEKWLNVFYCKAQ